MKKKFVKIKSKAELRKLGFKLRVLGSNIGIEKQNGPTLFFGEFHREPRLVVDCETIHEGALEMYPEAFEVLK